MTVSREYREYVMEQLGRIVPVTGRSMFGGFGMYSEGRFFGLIADDVVFLKVDETNRGDFERAGKGAFRPYGEESRPMNYYELPGELLEDVEALRPWVEKALAVASSKKMKR
ncbi:MAG: TfoX/Sxy family protein [Gemmatimonadota bacterium]